MKTARQRISAILLTAALLLSLPPPEWLLWTWKTVKPTMNSTWILL